MTDINREDALQHMYDQLIEEADINDQTREEYIFGIVRSYGAEGVDEDTLNLIVAHTEEAMLQGLFFTAVRDLVRLGWATIKWDHDENEPVLYAAWPEDLTPEGARFADPSLN